jgi:hypothetical protein
MYGSRLSDCGAKIALTSKKDAPHDADKKDGKRLPDWCIFLDASGRYS